MNRSANERVSDLPAQDWKDHGKRGSCCWFGREFDSTVIQVGRLDSEKSLAIRLSGENISEEHCYFENTDGKVTLNGLPGGSTASRDVSFLERCA